MLVRTIAVVALVLTPLAAQAADEDNHPFKKAKVGDYAKYSVVVKNNAGETKSSRTQTVTAASDKEVTLKTVDVIDGKEQPNRKPEQKIDITKPFDPVAAGEGSASANLKWEKHKDGTEKVKVGDKEYECMWTTYKAAAPPTAAIPIEGEVKVWLSKDVPFVVKRTLVLKTGKTEVVYSTDLIEFGSKK